MPTCGVCKEYFNSNRKLLIHYQLHRSEQLKGNEGPQELHEKPITSNEVQSNEVPPKKKKLFECSKCDKHFIYEVSLNKHMENGHKVVSHSCTNCDRQFIRKDALVRHINSVHKNIKKFECEVCGKCFASSTEMKKHLVTNAQGISSCKCPFKCFQCDQRFQSKKKYVKHTGKCLHKHLLGSDIN